MRCCRYMNKGDKNHRAIHGWFAWSWNANSPDTINILQNDWTSIDYRAISYLESVGLKLRY